jgi:hypothetical protein
VLSIWTERAGWNEPAQQQKIVSKTMAKPRLAADFARMRHFIILACRKSYRQDKNNSDRKQFKPFGVWERSHKHVLLFLLIFGGRRKEARKQTDEAG